MKKPFMEVFPTLQLREELKSVLEFASIDRITMNRDRDFMRIYLESDKLIVKSCIFELEQAITGQLFPDAKMTVKVIERFHLSRQYTPQNLMPIYEESILLELKEKLGAAELPDTSSGGGGVTVTHGSAVAEATAALVSLGYSQTEIGAALKTVEGAETLTAEQLVRQALRAMVTK